MVGHCLLGGRARTWMSSCRRAAGASTPCAATPATGSGIALKAAVEFAVANEPAADRRAALRWALAVAAQRSAHQLNGEPVPDTVAAEWARADQLVLSGLRAKLGLDRVRWAMSGAAPIPAETLGFFAGLAIPIAEIWGMSELTASAASATPATPDSAPSANSCPACGPESPTTANSTSAARW